MLAHGLAGPGTRGLHTLAFTSTLSLHGVTPTHHLLQAVRMRVA